MRSLAVATALACVLAASPAAAAETKSKDPGRGAPRAKEHRKAADALRAADQRPDTSPIAIVGGHVHPVTSHDVPSGTVLLRDGRIEAVLAGPRANEDWAARGYEVVDAAGRHVYPGLVAAGADGLGLNFDAWGVGSGDEALDASVADSFNAWDDGVELALSSGITTALVYRSPGVPRGPLAARAALLKLSYGEPRGVVLQDPAAVFASPRALAPGQRASLREALRKARKNDGKGEDEDGATVRALGARRIPLVIPADTAGDVAASLDVARELDLDLVLYLSTEAWTLADAIARGDAAAVQHVRGSWGKMRSSRRTEIEGGWRFDAAVRLHRAGVPVAILPYQDAPSTGGIAGRDFVTFPLEAAFAQRAGLTPQEALEAITIVPARIFGVDDRVGSLEEGKHADVIVTDGDVLDYRTYVRTAIVNGRIAFEAEGNRWWSWCIDRRDRALSSGSSEPSRPVAAGRAAGPAPAP